MSSKFYVNEVPVNLVEKLEQAVGKHISRWLGQPLSFHGAVRIAHKVADPNHITCQKVQRSKRQTVPDATRLEDESRR